MRVPYVMLCGARGKRPDQLTYIGPDWLLLLLDKNDE